MKENDLTYLEKNEELSFLPLLEGGRLIHSDRPVAPGPPDGKPSIDGSGNNLGGVLIAFPDPVDRWLMDLVVREFMPDPGLITGAVDIKSTFLGVSTYQPWLLIVDQELFATKGEALEQVFKANPAVKVLVIGESARYELAGDYIKAGVHGYVAYDIDGGNYGRFAYEGPGLDFCTIFRTIREGEKYLCKGLKKHLIILEWLEEEHP